MAYKDKARKTAYQNQFIKTAYDRINLLVAKGKKEVIQSAAQALGLSVNSFIVGAIDKELERLEVSGVISIFSKEDTNSY